MAISPDSQWISTGGGGVVIMLWRASDGVVVHDWAAHHCNSLAFSPDSHQLASCGTDGRVHLWDVVNGQHLASLGYPAVESSENRSGIVSDVDTMCAWSPDGAQFVEASSPWLGAGTVRVWDAHTFQQISTITGFPGRTTPVASLPDTWWWAVFAFGRPRMLGALTTSGAPSSQRKYGPFTIVACAYDPSSSRVATGTGNGEVCIWSPHDVDWSELVLHPAGERGASTEMSVEFSPDGRLLLSVSKFAGGVVIWDSHSGCRLRSLEPDEDEPRFSSACFSPDGKYVATGSLDGVIRFWSTVDWAVAGALAEHSSEIDRMVFAPNGEFLSDEAHLHYDVFKTPARRKSAVDDKKDVVRHTYLQRPGMRCLCGMGERTEYGISHVFSSIVTTSADAMDEYEYHHAPEELRSVAAVRLEILCTSPDTQPVVGVRNVGLACDHRGG
ncbi:WD40 repeat-like protein [Dichomitus squalens]|uniref:WD40 repeat-like protein n=1 Tax=Dichomitus squalens TaxID=114155 RepID=A0A4Q9MN59_9APHY|nr:WD40 repeat-like protein [Dichomitus squalens]